MPDRYFVSMYIWNQLGHALLSDGVTDLRVHLALLTMKYVKFYAENFSLYFWSCEGEVQQGQGQGELP